MKKILLIIGLTLFTIFAYSQKPKVSAVRYTAVTTTERDNFNVPAGEFWRIYNTTTAQNEYWDGDSWEDITAGGEANTASSQGTGTTIFYQKLGVDLQFNAIKSENNLLTVSLDGTTHDVELTVNQGNISITASQVSDFDTEVSNNSSVTDNTAKDTNVPTALSTGTVTATTYGITSDGGADDLVLVEADTDDAGLLGADKWDEIVANTAKPTGSGTTNKVAKFTGANSLGDSQIFDDGTYVGIGTINPLTKLHLSSTTTTNLTLEREATSVFLNSIIGSVLFRGGESTILNVGSIEVKAEQNWLSTRSDTYMVFSTVNTGTLTLSEKLRIKSNGDIDIPSGNLTLSGNVTANSFIKDGGLSTEFLKADGSVSTGIAKSDLVVALRGKVALGDVSGTVDIDTSLGIHFTMNMTGNITSLTFSNLTNEELKTITLQITGNFTIVQPASVKGNWDGFDGTKTNQIQIYLFDISTPTFSSALLNW